MVKRARRLIRQMIGRAQKVTTTFKNWWSSPITRDWSRRDYAFWDKARHCQAKGLELSGLFLKPLASKTASWVQGVVPRWTMDSPKGQELLTKWWADHHAQIIRTFEDAVALGDSFIVVNADDGFTLTLLPPNVVQPIVDEDDFSRIIGWKITEVHPHPSKPGVKMTIVDEYTAMERVRTRYRNGTPVGTPERYPNLIGLIPVIHVPNNRTSDSVFGEPEGAALLPLLQRYGMVLEAALSGNVHQGRPTPVGEFESVDQLEKFWEMGLATGLITRETINHDDGTSEQYDQINFDSEQFMALAGGKFHYAQPGSFAKDTEILLGLLFYLMLQHSEIPEFAWGNAIASSKASAESQLAPFMKWVEKKRGECTGWMLELARVVLAYYSLVETGVNAQADLSIAWEPLTEGDDQLTLQAIEWAYAEGLLDDETALDMLPIDIQDVAGVLAKAKKQAEERRAQRQEDDELNMQKRIEAERRAQEEADADDEDLERAA
jgi:hypothetical protein